MISLTAGTHVVPKKAAAAASVASVVLVAPAATAAEGGDSVDGAIGALVDAVKASGGILRSGISAFNTALDVVEDRLFVRRGRGGVGGGRMTVSCGWARPWHRAERGHQRFQYGDHRGGGVGEVRGGALSRIDGWMDGWMDGAGGDGVQQGAAMLRP
eukprot:353115-Chlamydomonas_euryale.AAC.2